MRLFRTSPAIRPRRRTARRSARSAVALALVASLLSPVPAAPQQDGNVPDPQPDAQLITDVWGYAAETEKGYDHVLGWMRVLKALGALTSMTAAEAQANADQHLAARWDPVVEELRQLETQDGYQPDPQVVSDVQGYAADTSNEFDHVLRWMRVLNAFGALTGMTAAEAQGYADRGSGWERWVPVAAELAKLEGGEDEGASGDQGGEPEPQADPVFVAAAMTFSIAEDHADGASVGTVTATDANGDTLTYSLTSTDTAPFPLNVALFTINSATGEITVASGVQLDFETQQTHLVEVGVSDGNDADGNPETTPTVDATIWVTIRVIDTEDDELRIARQSTRPAACADAATKATWLTSVTSTSGSISVTFVDPLPAASGSTLRLNVCDGAGELDITTVVWLPADHPAGGSTHTITSAGLASDSSDVPLSPGSDYWVRLDPRYGTGVDGHWHYIPTKAALVSNTGQTAGSTFAVNSTFTQAQTFTTGDHAAGYTLTDVGLRVGSWTNSSAFTASIYSTTSGGAPDSSLHTLTNPASALDGAANVFLAPAGATLTAQTTYALVLEGSAADTASLSSTTTNAEDSGAASGWSIGDSRHWMRTTDTSWSTASQEFRIWVGATPVTSMGSTPAITIAAGTSPVTEGAAAEFTVTADSAPSADLTVNLTVADASGSDFVASGDEGSKTVTIAANSTTATYSVPTVSDTTDEANGDVTVTVGTGTGYTVGSTSSASVTVNDDDDTLVANTTQTDGGDASPRQRPRAGVHHRHQRHGLQADRRGPGAGAFVRQRADLHRQDPPQQ